MTQSPGWWTYSWPGLPGLWYAGRWRGLMVALMFSALLNVALLVTFVPSFRVDRLAVGVMWATAAVFWIVSAWNSHLWAKRVARLPKREDLDRLFVLAQGDYIRGHWVEAERTLRNLLAVAPNDSDARLLLVGVLRRSGRAEEARDELAEMASSESSTRWAFEVARERAQLAEQLDHADDALGPRLAELPSIEELKSERVPDERREAA